MNVQNGSFRNQIVVAYGQANIREVSRDQMLVRQNTIRDRDGDLTEQF